MFPSQAWAQQLNLKPRYVPKAGDGLGTLVLVRRLETRIAEVSGQMGPDPAARPRESISLSLTTLACDLLRRGEELGPDGSMHVLAGRALLEDLPALEAWIASDAFDDRARLAIASDLLATGAADSKSLSAPQLFRLLRDRLAPLVPATGPPALHGPWPVAVSIEASRVAQASVQFADQAAALRLGDAVGAKAAHLDALLADAAHHPSFAETSDQILRAADDAARLLRTPPPWLGRGTASLNAQLGKAITELCERDSAPDGLLRLRRLALVARCCRDLAAIRDARALRTPTTAFEQAALTLADPPTPTDLERWRTLADALDTAATPPTERNDLDRALRPALASLTAATDESRNTLLSTLPRLLEGQGITTDPSIVSAMAAHRRRLGDVDMLGDLSAALGESEKNAKADAGKAGGTKADPRNIIRAHLLKLAQDVARPGTRDIAVGALRDVAREMSLLCPFPHEAELRAAEPSLARAALGDNAAPLLAMIDQARASWASAAAARVAAGKPLDTSSAALLAAIDTYLIASAATSRNALSILGAWPPTHLSANAAAELTLPLRAPLDACASALHDHRPDLFIAGAKDLRARPAALILGALALRMPFAAPGPTPQDAAAAARPTPLPASLALLAFGGPDPERAWLASQADAIAVVCRYAEELAAPNRDQARAEDLRKFLDSRCRTILTALD